MDKIRLMDIFENPISGEWGKEQIDDSDNSVGVIRTTNFSKSIRIKSNSNIVRRIIHETKVEKKKLLLGDIIIEKSGGSPTQPVGRVLYYDIKDEINLCNNFTSILRAKDGNDSKYLVYLMHFLYSRGEVLKHQNQTTGIINLKLTKYLETTKVELPPLRTQEKIVQVLDKAQELIDLRKKQIELLDDLIQSVFYDMFGDPVKNTKGWEETIIGNSCHFIKDGPHKSLEYVEEGIPFISVKDIIKGWWDFSNVRYISREVYEENKGRCKPEYGDVLYTKGGTTGFAKLVDIDIDFLNWVHVAVLKFDKDKMNGKFFEIMLNTPYCYSQSQRYTRGIANRDLVLGEMKKIKHFIPPLSIQNEFSQIVQRIEEQKKLMQQSLTQMENNFNSLMQRAFKGELFN